MNEANFLHRLINSYTASTLTAEILVDLRVQPRVLFVIFSIGVFVIGARNVVKSVFKDTAVTT